METREEELLMCTEYGGCLHNGEEADLDPMNNGKFIDQAKWSTLRRRRMDNFKFKLSFL